MENGKVKTPENITVNPTTLELQFSSVGAHKHRVNLRRADAKTEIIISMEEADRASIGGIITLDLISTFDHLVLYREGQYDLTLVEIHSNGKSLEDSDPAEIQFILNESQAALANTRLIEKDRSVFAEEVDRKFAEFEKKFNQLPDLKKALLEAQAAVAENKKVAETFEKLAQRIEQALGKVTGGDPILVEQLRKLQVALDEVERLKASMSNAGGSGSGAGGKPPTPTPPAGHAAPHRAPHSPEKSEKKELTWLEAILILLGTSFGLIAFLVIMLVAVIGIVWIAQRGPIDETRALLPQGIGVVQAQLQLQPAMPLCGTNIVTLINNVTNTTYTCITTTNFTSSVSKNEERRMENNVGNTQDDCLVDSDGRKPRVVPLFAPADGKMVSEWDGFINPNETVIFNKPEGCKINPNFDPKKIAGKKIRNSLGEVTGMKVWLVSPAAGPQEIAVFIIRCN